MNQTMITRPGFCEHCFIERRPKTGNTFLTYGQQGFHVMTSERNGMLGFTPHIYRLIKTIGTNIVAERVCSLYECGVYKENDGVGWWYMIDKTKWQRCMFTIESWNALVQYKRDWQYWI